MHTQIACLLQRRVGANAFSLEERRGRVACLLQRRARANAFAIGGGRLGGNEGDLHEITILHRVVRWNGPVIEFEADPKHVVRLCEELGLDGGSKGFDCPAVRETKEDVVGEDPEVQDRWETTRFRALAATANYLAQDRLDIQ